MLHLIWQCIIGLIVGFIAKLLMPGKDPSGFFITIALGIGGSLIATWIGRAIGLYGADSSAGFIMSVIGAMVLLFIYHLMTRRRSV